jgi:hypothetical protein
MCNKITENVHDKLFSHFQTKAQMQWPCLFIFSLMIKDKRNISLTLKILHLRRGSNTVKVTTFFTPTFCICFFLKLFMILIFTLTINIYKKKNCEKGCRCFYRLNIQVFELSRDKFSWKTSMNGPSFFFELCKEATYLSFCCA